MLDERICKCGKVEKARQHHAEITRGYHAFEPASQESAKCGFQWDNGYAWGKVCGQLKGGYSHREGGDHEFLPAPMTEPKEVITEGPYKDLNVPSGYGLTGPNAEFISIHHGSFELREIQDDCASTAKNLNVAWHSRDAEVAELTDEIRRLRMRLETVGK